MAVEGDVAQRTRGVEDRGILPLRLAVLAWLCAGIPPCRSWVAFPGSHGGLNGGRVN